MATTSGSRVCVPRGGPARGSAEPIRLPDHAGPDPVRRALVESLPLYRRMAGRRLRSAIEADDVVQAFSLRALERAGQLRDPLAVRGWLRRIFETTLLDYCRASTRRRQREIAFDIDLHDRQQAPEQDDERFVDAAIILSALIARLRRDYAEVIANVELLERPRAAVAAELGVTVNNLTVRLHRARGALRQVLFRAPGLAGSLRLAA